MSGYKCFICGKKNVKLWRPYIGTAPLVCATCAEELQSPCKYIEESIDNESNIKVVETNLFLPRWTINDEGLIPAYHRPHKKGYPYPMTDQLVINLSSITQLYKGGSVTMIPAVPIKTNVYTGYINTSEEQCKWWKELPTK